MKHEATEVRNYNFTSQDRLFLDANIWLYLYAQLKPQAHWVKIYSEVFDRILKAESEIYIDVLIVSEVVNRYTRIKHQLLAPSREIQKISQKPRFQTNC